jgi:hypothetical protein
MSKKWFLLALVLVFAASLSYNVFAREAEGGGITTVPTPIWAYPDTPTLKFTGPGGFVKSGVKSIASTADLTISDINITSDNTLEFKADLTKPELKLGLKPVIITFNDDALRPVNTFFVVPGPGLGLKIHENVSSIAQKGTVPDVLTALFANNSGKVVAIGTYGKLRYSVNFGRSWIKSIIGDFDTHFTCMRFSKSNPLIGYAGGFQMIENPFGLPSIAPIMYKTVNGGLDWTAQTLPAAVTATYRVIMDLAIAPDNDNLVIAVGASDVSKGPALSENCFLTMNGGTTWAAANIQKDDSDFPVMLGVDIIRNGTGPKGNPLYDIWAVAVSHADFATIAGSELMRTVKGNVKPAAGAPAPETKNVLYFNTSSGGAWIASPITTGTISLTAGFRIKCFSPTERYVTGVQLDENKGIEGYVLKYNSGVWTDISPANPNKWTVAGQEWSVSRLLFATAWLNKNVGIVGGVYGGIFKTVDGGLNWDYKAYEYRTVFDVAMVDETKMWAVGGSMGKPTILPSALTQTQTQTQTYSVKASGVQGFQEQVLPKEGPTLPLGSFALTETPNPTITSLSPNSAVRGESKTVTFTGTYLWHDPSMRSINMGDDIIVDNISAAGTAATARITPTMTAIEGVRTNCTFTTPDETSATFTFTVAATPTITIPLPVRTISNVTPTRGTVGSALDMAITVNNLSTANRVDSVTLRWPRTGSTIIYPGSALTVREGIVTLPPITPTLDKVGDAYASIVIDGEVLTYDTPIRIEPTGILAVFPSPLPESVLGPHAATAGATAQPRIVFTLAAAKNVELLIIDPKDLKVLFRRKVSGIEGYNELLWDGKTDFGNLIPPGSYILQMVSEGKVAGTYPFVVTGRRM